MNADLISRQAAIEAINNHFGFSIEEEYGSAVQEIINGLPASKPMWIPVTERLPKPNQYNEEHVIMNYLVQNEYGDMMVAAYMCNRKGETWWEQTYLYTQVGDEIVAWMPLPELYKEKENEHTD